jgi:hypothetical protein
MLEIISIHIPKTAGSSFLTILDSVYNKHILANFDRKNYPDTAIPPPEQFILQLNNNISVIHGHFRYSEIKSLKDIKTAKVITWFRNPVERVISNYCFFKKRITLAPDNVELQNRKNETLIEYASQDFTRNRMNKFIEGLEVDKFFFIGITEYFNSDLKVLSKMLNWKSFDIPRINDNSEFKLLMPKATDEERKIIADLNKIDIDIYTKALEIRNKRLI